jgi:hypothetical protein
MLISKKRSLIAEPTNISKIPTKHACASEVGNSGSYKHRYISHFRVARVLISI